jgi:hypothetical protein
VEKTLKFLVKEQRVTIQLDSYHDDPHIETPLKMLAYILNGVDAGYQYAAFMKLLKITAELLKKEVETEVKRKNE